MEKLKDSIFRVFLTIFVVLIFFSFLSIRLPAQYQAGTINAPVGTSWDGMTLYKAGGKLFVADSNNSEILIYDASSLALVNEISLTNFLPDKPRGLAVHEGTGTLYVSLWSDNVLPVINYLSIVAIDANDYSIGPTIDDLYGICLVIDESRALLYTFGTNDSLQRILTAININTNTVCGSLDIDDLFGEGAGTANFNMFNNGGLNPRTGELVFYSNQHEKFVIVDGPTLAGELIRMEGTATRNATWNWLENKIYFVDDGLAGIFIYDRDTGTSSFCETSNNCMNLYFSQAANRIYSTVEVIASSAILNGTADMCQTITMPEGGLTTVDFVNSRNHAIFCTNGGTLPKIYFFDENTLEVIRSFTGSCGTNSKLVVDQNNRRVFVLWTYLSESHQESCIQVIDDLDPAPIISVSSPNSGESWNEGSSHTITWTSSGTIYKVKIEYSANNGTDWTTVIDSTINTGSYLWTVPEVESSQCLVRISDATDPIIKDFSNVVFSIIFNAVKTESTPTTPTNQLTGTLVANYSYTPGSSASNSVDKDDFLATWDGQGVYYRDSDTGAWMKMASPATLITSGDLDNDGIDDLIGIWPGQGGVWIKYSKTGEWAKLASTAKHIATGDMNGDGKSELLGTWDKQGVYYRNSSTTAWVKMASPATLITSGDLDNDGTDDLIGIWPSQGGVWAKYSKTGAWAKLSTTAVDIATGDMNGDGRDDLLATWDGQGVYYRNSFGGAWVKMASPATQVTSGDLDGDGADDVIGIWPSQAGVWVKYSKTGTWAMLSSTAVDIAAGKLQNAIQVSPVTPYTVRLTNNLKYQELKIYRKLINEYEEVVTLGPKETYVDSVKWDGTQYFYWGETIATNPKKTNEVGIITDIAEITKERGLFYNWNDVARSQNISDRVLNIDPSSTVYDYMVHGVNVKVVYEKPVADTFTKDQLEGWFLQAVQMFHRHWQFFEGFPLNEIRITCWDETYVEFENVLGFQDTLNHLLITIDDAIQNGDEGQSHGMGHIWVGPLLRFPNGWMWEGFDSYNGMVTINARMAKLLANLTIDYFLELKLEPLDIMYNKYFGTPYAGVYYIKGSLFAYLVSRRLIEEASLNWSGFMKYLYDTYYLSENAQGQTTPQDGRLIDLKMALNTYSGLDFTDMFDDYVYGYEDITEGLQIESKYLPVFYSPSGKPIIQN